MGDAICVILPIKPLLFLELHSTDSTTEPPHSPPAPKPWQKRKNTNRIDTIIPAFSYVGNNPMSVLLIPINKRVVTNVAFRPMRSP
ncbi:Uncharacterised protein [Chlamydia trachomatis]|nr:Uncharacterised protein [Chlamydia trachomatis]